MSEEEKAIEYFGKRILKTKVRYLTYIDSKKARILLNLIDKLQKEIKLKDKVIDNLYADIECEYSGTSYLKSLEEYYKEIENERFI